MARKPTTPEAETAAPEVQAAPEVAVTPEPEASAEQATPPATAPTLVVTGPRAGRRRAGRHFGSEPVSIRLDDLSEAEWDAIEADPALTVQIVNAPY